MLRNASRQNILCSVTTTFVTCDISFTELPLMTLTVMLIASGSLDHAVARQRNAYMQMVIRQKFHADHGNGERVDTKETVSLDSSSTAVRYI